MGSIMPAKSKWALERKGFQYSSRLYYGVNSIGRAQNSTIKIKSNTKSECCSRKHCEITVETDDINISIVDLQSSNGTFVNKTIVNGQQILCENDEIGIGCYDACEDDLKNVVFNVFILRKIRDNCTTGPVDNAIQCNMKHEVPELVIDLLDSDEEQDIQFEQIATTSKSNDLVKVKRKHDNNSNLNAVASTSNGHPQLNLKTGIKIESVVSLKQTRNSMNGLLETLKKENDSPTSKRQKMDIKDSKLDKTNLCSKSNKKSPKHLEKILTFAIDDSSSDEDSVKSLPKITKPNSPEICLSPEIFDIPDDDEGDCEYSQYVMEDMKQEALDLDLEESYKKSPSTAEESSSNLRLSSPIYDYIDDSDDEDCEDFDEDTANWFTKLSQNIKMDVKVEFEKEPDAEPINDNLVELTTDIPEFFNGKKTSRNKPSENLTIDMEQKTSKGNSSKSVPLIDAPFLPVHRGKLRGICAEQQLKNLITKRRKSVQDKERLSEFDKVLKGGWINKSMAKKKFKKLNDEKKEKLKILAEKEAEKRKLKEIGENKTLNKAKVKCTDKNRGAFLAEPTITKPNQSSKTTSTNSLKPIETTKLKQIPKIKPSEAGKKDEIIEQQSSILHYEDNPRISNSKNAVDCKSTNVNNVKISCEDTNKRLDKCTNEIIRKRPDKLRFSSLQNLSTKIANPVAVPNKEHNLDLDKQAASISVLFDISNTGKKKSILKGIIKDTATIKKKVNFVTQPTIFYYPKESPDTVGVISNRYNKNKRILDMSKFNERRRLKFTDNVKDSSEEILSALLSWNTNWLDTSFEEVNGVNHTLVPMMHSFQSLDTYKKTIFPLMKLELWVTMHKKQKCNTFPKLIKLQLCSYQVIEKKSHSRITYECKNFGNTRLPENQIFIGEAVLVEINKTTDRVFGYVRSCTLINDNNGVSYYQILLETAIDQNILKALQSSKEIKLMKLAPITIELGEFNAVFRMETSSLLKKILNPCELASNEILSTKDIKYIGYDKLNDEQADIVRRTYLKCVNPNESNICLIEGPPGTGKSKVISNLSLQIIYGEEVRKLDRHILICAPSNTAIDEIVLKLIHVRKKMSNESNKFNLIRFGVTERMHPDVKKYSLAGLLNSNRKTNKTDASSEIALQTEKAFIEKKIKLIQMNKNHNSIDQDELYKFNAELNRINGLLNPSTLFAGDKDLSLRLLNKAHIICTTLTSCVKLLKYVKYFDICIVDEATQCNEPWTLIPLQFSINSLVLVGDKQQLPAIVQSKLSREHNYGKSLFTRMQECLEHETDKNPIMTLVRQYRMHPEISRWPNSYFYKSRLVDDTVTKQLNTKVKPYSVFGLPFKQNKNTGKGKIVNSLEADFVVELVNYLKEIMPFTVFSYGIITPYSEHRDYLIKKLIDNKIKNVEVNTIDSYQGKEKDVIIISNARTDGVGFLGETSRLNVSLTRAKKCLILCGTFSQLQHIPVWKSLLADAKARKIYYKITDTDVKDFQKNIIELIKFNNSM